MRGEMIFRAILSGGWFAAVKATALLFAVKEASEQLLGGVAGFKFWRLRCSFRGADFILEPFDPVIWWPASPASEEEHGFWGRLPVEVSLALKQAELGGEVELSSDFVPTIFVDEFTEEIFGHQT